MKRYIIRAAKYFLYLCILLFIVITVMVAFKFVPKDISQIFVNGYDSLWQMALIILVFAAVYPKFGYGQRELSVPGDPALLDAEVVRYMEAHNYVQVAPLEFKLGNSLLRATKMFEDKIVITHTLGGYIIEGRTKDILRVYAGLTNILRNE